MKKDIIKLIDVLSAEDIHSLNTLIRNSDTPSLIAKHFSKKYPGVYDSVIEYIKHYTLGYHLDTGFGNKIEPYYKKESDMIIPRYTYKRLSKEEKDIYNGKTE